MLVIGVVAIAVALGTSLAWLTAACDFPGRGFFSWALYLPMAMPAYVLAFVAVATLDYAGAVPMALRGWFGADLEVPPIRSTGGVIAVLGFASYPYVYLMARGAFLTHGARVLEAAQSLGYGPWSGLMRVAIPLARPWLAGGAALVAMETLADFGAVSVFNYDTFTTAIYKAWYGLFSVETALALALLLLGFVAIALAAEQLARGRGRHTAADSGTRAPVRLALPGARGWLAFAFAAAVFAAGFLLPGIALVRWALDVAPLDLDARYVTYILRTLSLAGMAAVACLALAVVLGYANRLATGAAPRVAARVATLGYAIPGTVLAVGVVTVLGGLDGAFRSLTGGEGLWLQGTVLALLLGYVARFLAVAYGPVQGGFARIRPALEEAARSLGLAPREVLCAPAPAAARRRRRHGAPARVRRRHEGNADHADDPALRLGHTGGAGVRNDGRRRMAARCAAGARHRGRGSPARRPADLENGACGSSCVKSRGRFPAWRPSIGCR